ncbi:MAG: phosphatase PAP2 family protein [Betaproteobacteria bacterium]|nr:phosphatase PAP2 family protein [Betaproteobacteria bacterium]
MQMRSTGIGIRSAPWAGAAWLLAAPAILWFGALAFGADRPDEFDAAGLTLAARGHMPVADAFFRAVTWAGSILVLMPLALAQALVAWGRLHAPGALFLPAALAGAALLGFAAKIAVDRNRPEVATLIEMPADASFPSAHTLQVSAFVTAWLLAPGRSRRPGSLEIALGALLVALVAWSRLHLQVHFPSDILFGLAAGILWVLALRRLPVWSRQP